ncbi:MAG: dolichol-phosphate mannosyltransferase [Candidatus Peregrinibacteria bacterium Greene0416_62]|nr:MAG: dolichol-phosphate mannosyltransferase [Candidatus Peregrinibacteria bacterium Greene0416_62]TSD00432.1 MAG: dolichol-phosphate mannosyltransferase [Candidatus Peregrinibacteria bacterium Greene1014_49]
MLSLILPTFNESENLPELLPKIRSALSSVPHEIIVVDDDSPDSTWKVAQELSQQLGDVHVIRRIGRRGLSSAVIEGFLAAKGDVLAVMDADGQHDTELLGKLHAAVQQQGGIAIGSRYVAGGSVGAWDERRYMLSRIATRMALSLCAVKAKDPMSGFFAIDRKAFEEVLPRLNPKGFKILLDLLVHVPKTTHVTELPFTFATRKHGESKLSRRVQLEFLEYLYDVSLGNWIPLTFVKYCIVGALGVGVHLTAYLFLSAFFSHGLPLTLMGFSLALLGAIETAIIFNFWLNNLWTFAHAKLQGFALIPGFLKYNFACVFGALANYAVSTYLFSHGIGEIVSVIIGASAGIIWNYTMSRMFAWKNA